MGGAGGSGEGNGGGVSEARRLPQSERSPTSPSRQVETLAEDDRHCGTGEGMQGSKRHLEASPRSGGPGGGLQDSPKDWCITATDATARATLLTYAIANKQDSCRREDKKGQCQTLPIKLASDCLQHTHLLSLEVQVRGPCHYLLPNPISHTFRHLFYIILSKH